MEQNALSMEQNAPKNKVRQCEFCLENFSRLDKHKCKLECDGIRILEKQLNIKIENIPKDKCRFCEVPFTRSTHLSRHQLTCKSKIEYKQKLEKQLESKTQTAVSNVMTNSNNTTNNITNNINQTNNITIRAFGKENMEYITRNVILRLCRKANLRNEIIPRLVRQLHCNPQHPENHNIIVSNLRAPYVKVYDGEDCTVDASKDIIDKVMDNVAGLLTDECAFGHDNKFKQYERAIERIEEDMNETESKFKSEQRVKVKRDLYNNKNMVQRSIKRVT